MRKLLMAILAVAGAASLFMMPAPAKAQGEEGIVQRVKPDGIRTTRAARLRTEADPGDPDTVWIGHVYDAAFTAGGKMQAGGYGPYHVGRGGRRGTRPWPRPRRQRGRQWDLGLRPLPGHRNRFAPGLVAGGTPVPERRDELRRLWARVLRSGLRQQRELRHQPGRTEAHLRRGRTLAP